MWLKNGRIYDSDSRSFRSGDLEIIDGSIAAVGEKAPAAAEAIDLEGAYLLPGFFDCHVHICVMTEAADHSLLWINALPGEIAIYACRAQKCDMALPPGDIGCETLPLIT